MEENLEFTDETLESCIIQLRLKPEEEGFVKECMDEVMKMRREDPEPTNESLIKQLQRKYHPDKGKNKTDPKAARKYLIFGCLGEHKWLKTQEKQQREAEIIANRQAEEEARERERAQQAEAKRQADAAKRQAEAVKRQAEEAEAKRQAEARRTTTSMTRATAERKKRQEEEKQAKIQNIEAQNARNRLIQQKKEEQARKLAAEESKKRQYQDYMRREYENEDVGNSQAYTAYPTNNQSYATEPVVETEIPQNNENIEQPRYPILTKAVNFASPYVRSAIQSGIHGVKTAATFVRDSSNRHLYNRGYLDENYDILPDGQRQRIQTRASRNNLHLDDDDDDVDPYGRGRKTRAKRATKKKRSANKKTKTKSKKTKKPKGSKKNRR